MSQNVAALLRLMLVTDDRWLANRDLVRVCQAAVRGGVSCVQLRLKEVEPRELLARARELISALDVPVLINDRLDVALAAGAAGVHLGPDDLPLRLAKRIVPPGFLIGASVGHPGESGAGQGADYWGVGPWRPTNTKPDPGAAIGRAGFRAVVAVAGGLPCIAIGGIRPEDVGEVRASGGAGVAVVSGILGEEDPEAASRRYRSEIMDLRSPD